MDRQIFKYLIPAYILWFVVHVYFFFNLIFSQLSQIGTGTPAVGTFGLLILSQFLLIISGSAFMIYMLVDCALRTFKKESPKIIWIIIILLFSVIGSIIYYYVHGKETRE